MLANESSGHGRDYIHSDYMRGYGRLGGVGLCG